MERRKAMLTAAPRDYGVTDPAEARRMTGRELLEAIMGGWLPAPPMARTLSFLLTEVGDGFAVFEGDPGPHLLNPLGVIHGGWALTLIDSAAGCAGHSLLPAGARSRPRSISPARSPRRPAGCAPRGGSSTAAGASSPVMGGSLTRGGRLLAHGTSTLMVLTGDGPAPAE
jgi:acyl-coenzyme A thioesterase PaaI-like protein